MNNHITKAIAMISAVVITAGTLAWNHDSYRSISASAKTLAEIETEKKEKQAQIDQKKIELAALADDINKKAAYEQTLNEEINLINGKMLLIDTQLQNILQDIDQKQLEIDALQIQIDEQQLAVDDGLEAFKTRIRTLYVHGNDSVLSALVGATSFYDVLAKIDLIKRISKHDDDMIDSLRDEIKELNNNQQDLTASLQALNLKQTEMQVLLDEFSASRTELNDVVKDTDLAKQLLINQQSEKQGELAANESDLQALKEEEEELILEAARKAAEEAQRLREEQERRAREEDARRTTTTTTTTTTVRTTQAPVVTTARPVVTTARPVVTTARPAATTARPAATTARPTTAAPVVTTAAPVVTTAAPTTQATPAPTTPAPTTAPPAPATTAATTAAPAPNAEYRGGQLAWPAPGYYDISSPFGPRWGRIHKGIDIISYSRAINGANACAAASGTVITAKYGYNGGYGNYVQIDHGNGLCTLYAHLSAISVSQGQHINVGEKIGNVGSTGNSTGPHLHFSVIVDGTFVDPMPYLY